MLVKREEPNIDEATALATRAFRHDFTLNYREEVASVVTKGIYYAVRTNSGRLIGFEVIRFYDNLIYIDGMAIEPDFQGSQVARTLMLAALRDYPVEFIAMITQSSFAYKAFAAMCSSVYPHPGQLSAEVPDVFVQAVEVLTAAEQRPFPIVRGLYAADFYGERPISSDTALQSWWDSLGDFETGDGHYCIGQVDPALISPQIIEVIKPPNGQVRIFQSRQPLFHDRKPGTCFECVTYSTIHSPKHWENRHNQLDPDCGPIAQRLYDLLPELHQVYFYRDRISCDMSPSYEWTPEKEQLIIDILMTSQEVVSPA